MISPDESILKQYNIRSKKIVREKSYFIVNTEMGIKVLKKTSDPVDSIVFQHQVKEYLYAQGFTNIDRFYLTNDGTPYASNGDNLFVLTDIFDYKESDFSNNAVLMNVTKIIAQMHLILEDMVFYGSIPKRKNILENYKKDFASFNQIRKHLGVQKSLTDFDVLFVKNYEFYKNQISTALEILEKYSNFMNDRVCVCHNSIKGENILMDADFVYVINFSKASLCNNTSDLCSLIRSYSKNFPTALISPEKIIEVYSQINPIDDIDIKIMYSLLLYPLKFVQLCLNYYSKKRTWTPNAITNRVSNIIENKDVYEEYISSIKI